MASPNESTSASSPVSMSFDDAFWESISSKVAESVHGYMAANMDGFMAKAFEKFSSLVPPPTAPVQHVQIGVAESQHNVGTTTIAAALEDQRSIDRESMSVVASSITSDSTLVNNVLARRRADNMSDLVPKPQTEDENITLSKEILDQVGHNVTEPEDDLGDKIPQHVADRIATHFDEGRLTAVKNSICGQYLMPKNCTFLAPKKLNDEVRAFEGFKARPNEPGRETRERTLYNIEQQLARVSTILTRMVSGVLEEVDNDVQVDVKKLAKSSLDAISMVSHSQMLLDDLRKDNIRPLLKQDVRKICQHGKYYDSSEYLFGSSYGRLVKETREDYNNLRQSVQSSQAERNSRDLRNMLQIKGDSGAASSSFLAPGQRVRKPPMKHRIETSKRRFNNNNSNTGKHQRTDQKRQKK